MEIAPGVRGYLAKSMLRGANAYHIDTGSSRVWIDAPKWTLPAMLSDAASESEPRASYVFVTHCDTDHVDGLWQALQATHAKVVSHEAEAPLLQARVDRPTRYPLGLRVPAVSRPTRKHPVTVDIPAADGAQVAGLTVLHTPGHTPGSACYWWRERSVLFAGDMFMNVGKLSRPLSMATPDPVTWLRSAKRIAELDFDICCFGHGALIISGASRAIREFVARL